MAKEGSVAPKERINIKYVSATGGQQEEIELPLRLMIMGDFKGKPDESPIEDRDPISVDKNNFASVMRDASLSKSFNVRDKLKEGATEEDTIAVNLSFSSLKDFSPDSISENIPEIKKLKQIREALVALKTPLGNVKSFRHSLQELIQDSEKCEEVLQKIKSGVEEE